MSLITPSDLFNEIERNTDHIEYQPLNIRFRHYHIIGDVTKFGWKTRVYDHWKKLFNIDELRLFTDHIETQIGNDCRATYVRNKIGIKTKIYNLDRYSEVSQQKIREEIKSDMIEKWLLDGNKIILGYGSIPRFLLEIYKITDSGCYIKQRTLALTAPTNLPIQHLYNALTIVDHPKTILRCNEQLKEILPFNTNIVELILCYIF